jgi:hypothetical protein
MARAVSDRPGVPPGGAEPSLTTVEHRGIEYIPQTDRWGLPRALFGMWAGAVWNVEYLIYEVQAEADQTSAVAA